YRLMFREFSDPAARWRIMKNTESRRQIISVAQRGQIVQRVIVDGWTSAEAAAAFDVPRRIVEVWVTDFRRHGMASLRQEPGRTIVTEIIRFTVWHPVRAMWRKLLIGLRGSITPEPLVQAL